MPGAISTVALGWWALTLPCVGQLRKRLRKGHWAHSAGGILCNLRLVLLMALSLGSPVLPTSCATCLVGQPPCRARWHGPRVTLCPLLRPSGASKVTAYGSRQSRLTARMAAGAPGPTSGPVRGRAGAECDPAAGAVTIPSEYASLGRAHQGPLSLGPRGLEGRQWGAGTERRTSAGSCVFDGEDPPCGWGRSPPTWADIAHGV